MRVLLVDHQDSFVHTLAGYFAEQGAAVSTLRAGFDLALLDEFGPDLVVLSPGPGRPADFDCDKLLSALDERGLPAFGVCLGLQAMVEHAGGSLGLLDTPVHGKPGRVRVLGGELLAGLPAEFTGGPVSLAARAAGPGDRRVRGHRRDARRRGDGDRGPGARPVGGAVPPGVDPEHPGPVTRSSGTCCGSAGTDRRGIGSVQAPMTDDHYDIVMLFGCCNYCSYCGAAIVIIQRISYRAGGRAAAGAIGKCDMVHSGSRICEHASSRDVVAVNDVTLFGACQILTFRLADGTWPGYLAVPSASPGPWPAVVVIHEAFGLNDDIRSKADEFAAHGYLALAPDLFDGKSWIRCIRNAFQQLRAGRGAAFDALDGAREFLAAGPDCTGKTGVIGFCLGGGFALLCAPRPGFDVGVGELRRRAQGRRGGAGRRLPGRRQLRRPGSDGDERRPSDCSGRSLSWTCRMTCTSTPAPGTGS